MSIATEITRLRNAKAALKESIEAKGVTVEDSAKLDEYPALVDSIPQGGGSEYTEDEYLTFTAEQDNSSISLRNSGGNAPIIYYKKNNGDYTLWDYSSISMNKGDVVKMYGGENNFNFSKSTTVYSKFVMTGKIAASGVTNSLLSRIKTPVITPYCYFQLFHDCAALTTAPELPAIGLADSCYNSMFYNCTALTTAPELPATILGSVCYYQMFYGCTNLTTAPELPATTLINNCYGYMFCACTNLNYVKAMFTTSPSGSYTGNWLYGAATTGTFVKNAAAIWEVSGADGIPTGWTIETATE